MENHEKPLNLFWVRAPLRVPFYTRKRTREPSQKSKVFSFSESMIRCVKFAPPGFSFCFMCLLFAFLHILASLISTPFVVPFVPEAVQRCKYQGSHNGKMRNAGCTLGKWEKHVCILCASCGYDLRITGNMPEFFWKKSQIECKRVGRFQPKKVEPFWHIFIYLSLVWRVLYKILNQGPSTNCPLYKILVLYKILTKGPFSAP